MLAFIMSICVCDTPEALVLKLRSPSAEVRVDAASWLSCRKEIAKDHMPELERSLKDESVPVRLYCARAILNVNRKHEAAIKACVNAFDKPSPNDDGYLAAETLLEHQLGKCTLPFLKRELSVVLARKKDRLDCLQFLAICCWGLGQDARDVLPELRMLFVDLQKTSDTPIAFLVAGVVQKIDSTNPETKEFLKKNINQAGFWFNTQPLMAIAIVSALGPDARPLVPDLDKLAKSGDAKIRRAAQLALKKINQE